MPKIYSSNLKNSGEQLYIMKKPVVFIIFNRPETTAIVFEKIREYKPAQLFVIADGPRYYKESEKQLCEEARAVIQVDWDCEVVQIFSDKNLGCKQRISTGLDEVFNCVEEAIILEDDCVPHTDFFPYCEELLDRYAHNTQIMAISGNNFQIKDFNTSYYFSIYPHCWGWATWKRAWQLIDVEMKKWPKYKEEKLLRSFFNDPFAINYWEDIFDKVYNKKIDSWAYPWAFTCWLKNGLTILPRRNLVSNIGFGEIATHTKVKDPLIENLPTYSIGFPLNHPKNIGRNKLADIYTTDYIYGVKQIKEQALINIKKTAFFEKLLSSKENIFKPYNKIAIFGTAKMGRIIYQYAIQHNIQVVYFIDNNRENQGKQIEGVPVSGLDIKYNDIDIIIVSIEGSHDEKIIEQLTVEFNDIKIVSWKNF